MLRGALVPLILSCALATGAAQMPDVREALRLGRSQDETLYAAFSAGYSLSPTDPVESAEIVTEFRRAVLIARERMKLGEFGFTERDLTVAMAPHLGQITFIVQIRLHPMHTFATPPAYDLYVASGPDTPPIAARAIKRDPVYALGPPGSPLVAVRLEGALPRASIAEAPAPELIVTDERANVLWRARIELSRFR